ncbi:hypothetical protein QQP08_018198 [Theobroma cacao]|uniref:Uncharacterized protein n=1 Tax=Theobroma cacao TaxID=3641 RepID=A0A061EVC4_THECC|nr:Uncharacterized protein TCM_022728 [Theobroma cacao]WRX22981.1 hypothetical protein QQP08_015468 [Theobroma cacao]WRX25711.1 hypothetical protein QQP08_018198 [Theobroma cacao]
MEHYCEIPVVLNTLCKKSVTLSSDADGGAIAHRTNPLYRRSPFNPLIGHHPEANDNNICWRIQPKHRWHLNLKMTSDYKLRCCQFEALLQFMVAQGVVLENCYETLANCGFVFS